jgi:hypothetical protein
MNSPIFSRDFAGKSGINRRQFQNRVATKVARIKRKSESVSAATVLKELHRKFGLIGQLMRGVFEEPMRVRVHLKWR